MHLTEIRLTNTITAKIVTSGYSDRYINLTAHYRAQLSDDALKQARDSHRDRAHASLERVRLEWTGPEPDRAAVDTLMLLTGEPWEQCYVFVRDCATQCRAIWEENDGSVYHFGPVRWEVLDAVAKLAEHQHRERESGRGNFTEEAVAKFRHTAQGATQEEIACARWWLSECNRTNARTGRTQVDFPNLSGEA